MKFLNGFKPMVGKIALLVVLGLGIANFANAQTPAVFEDAGFDPESNGGIPASDGGPSVPFDGGMSLLLLVAGIGYTAKRLREDALVATLFPAAK